MDILDGNQTTISTHTMAKARKTTKETNTSKQKCTTHQFGDIISIYDSDGRSKVRFCRHCNAREYMLNKKKDESDDAKTKG